MIPLLLFIYGLLVLIITLKSNKIIESKKEESKYKTDTQVVFDLLQGKFIVILLNKKVGYLAYDLNKSIFMLSFQGEATISRKIETASDIEAIVKYFRESLNFKYYKNGSIYTITKIPKTMTES